MKTGKDKNKVGKWRGVSMKLNWDEDDLDDGIINLVIMKTGPYSMKLLKAFRSLDTAEDFIVKNVDPDDARFVFIEEVILYG